MAGGSRNGRRRRRRLSPDEPGRPDEQVEFLAQIPDTTTQGVKERSIAQGGKASAESRSRVPRSMNVVAAAPSGRRDPRGHDAHSTAAPRPRGLRDTAGNSSRRGARGRSKGRGAGRGFEQRQPLAQRREIGFALLPRVVRLQVHGQRPEGHEVQRELGVGIGQDPRDFVAQASGRPEYGPSMIRRPS